MVGRLRGVSFAGRSSVDAGTLTVTAPTDIDDDDWLIALGAASGSPNGTISLPSGFTAYTTGHSFRVAGYKLASSESGDYDFACGNPDDDASWMAAIIVIRGCDPADPPEIGTVTTATGTSATGAGVTLEFGAGALLFCILEGQDNENVSPAVTMPSGYYEILDEDEETTSGSDAHAVVAAGLAYGIKPGATGDAVATLSQSRSATAFLLSFTQATISGTAPSPTEVLIEIDYYDEGGASVETLKYSRRGMIYPDNSIYEPRILSEIGIRQQGASAIALGGRVALTAAEVDLRNDDLAFDNILARNLAVGRDVVIKTMPDGDPWSASDGGGGAISGATTVFAGVVSGFSDAGRRERDSGSGGGGFSGRQVISRPVRGRRR